MRRLVQTAIGDQLAREILAGEVRDGDAVRVDHVEGWDGLMVGSGSRPSGEGEGDGGSGDGSGSGDGGSGGDRAPADA